MSESLMRLLDEASAETKAWLATLPQEQQRTMPGGLYWFVFGFPARNILISEADRLFAAALEARDLGTLTAAEESAQRATKSASVQIKRWSYGCSGPSWAFLSAT